MKLLKLLFRDNRLPLSGIVLLSLCSAMLSVGVIAFINLKLIRLEGELATTLLSFLGLLAALLLCSGAGQVALHTLGHRFVYRLRRSLVRRVLDTDIERLEQIGGARILASLSSDIRNITIAFVYLPELTYGLILSIAAFAYLAWLSPALFGITAGWLGLTLLVGWFFVGKVNQHIRLLREAEDHLYQDYQAIIDGRKELALNRDRARLLYDEEFDRDARAYRDNVTRADIFNGLAGNWANAMVLGSIGLVFFCAIETGLVLRVAKAHDLLGNLEQTLQQIEDQIGVPQLVVGADCVHRKLEAEWHNEKEQVAALLGRYNTTGFATYGEQFRGIHVNQTFVGIAIGRSRTESKEGA